MAGEKENNNPGRHYHRSPESPSQGSIWDQVNKRGATVAAGSMAVSLAAVLALSPSAGDVAPFTYSHQSALDAAVVQPAATISGAYTQLERQGVVFDKKQQAVRSSVDDRLEAMETFAKPEVQDIVFGFKVEGAKEAKDGLWSPESLTDAGARLMEIEQDLKDITDGAYVSLLSKGVVDTEATRISAGLVGLNFIEGRGAPEVETLVRSAQVDFGTQLNLLDDAGTVQNRLGELSGLVGLPDWNLTDERASQRYVIETEDPSVEVGSSQQRQPVDTSMRARYVPEQSDQQNVEVAMNDARQDATPTASGKRIDLMRDSVAIHSADAEASLSENGKVDFENRASSKQEMDLSGRERQEMDLSGRERKEVEMSAQQRQEVDLSARAEARQEIDMSGRKRIPVKLDLASRIKAKIGAATQESAVETSPEEQSRLARIHQKAQEMAARKGAPQANAEGKIKPDER
jgi:hypothetical protein